MPYPNEHACRIRDPGEFQDESFRRIDRGEGSEKLTIIIGRPKGQTTTATQAYRYDKEIWTEGRARTHCKENDGAFEAATKEAIMLSDKNKRNLLQSALISEYGLGIESPIPKKLTIEEVFDNERQTRMSQKRRRLRRP